VRARVRIAISKWSAVSTYCAYRRSVRVRVGLGVRVRVRVRGRRRGRGRVRVRGSGRGRVWVRVSFGWWGGVMPRLG